ncbi:hypothetical protein QTP70_002291 [Hemibagrus guttatus]|uniref:Ig-like domain-containing protein n=1 Tax=Hemibagrus guttatus TaxID=175788 RepID=A0AAE0UGY8_9TELE|nr:hypothetical protein QTP70_002291 [Hemibagrus guttatus]
MFTVIFMYLCLSLGDSMADSIEPLFTHKAVDEGESTQDSITPTSSAVYGKEEQAVTLSCDYEYTVAMNNLQWYRQYSNAAPEFLVLLTESGANQTGNTPRPHLSAKVHKSLKRVDLEISPASVSDSALYYCALQPTVTGKPTSLYKNLQRPQT